MLKLVFTFWLATGAVFAQAPMEAALTNQPRPYSSSILVPQAQTVQPIVPQVRTIEIPSATSTPAAAVSPSRLPTRSVYDRPGNVLPSAADLATRAVKVVPPPFPEQKPAPVAAPVNPAGQPAAPVEKQLYVSATGTDTGDGTPAKPWRTIQRAANAAQPGDVVLVEAGEYEAFRTVRGGTQGHPITFRAVGQAIVLPAGGPTAADNITVRESDYVIIEGFTVRDAARCGIFVVDSRGVILRQNLIGPVGRFGILTGFAVDVQIISNKTFSAAAEHGIYVSNSREPNDNPVIRFNESYDNGAAGLQVNGDCGMGGDGLITGAIIEGNIIHDNQSKGMSLISMAESLVQNNLIYNNGKKNGAGGIHLTDELGCGHPSSGNVVVNNTIVEPRIACLRITDAAKDNIIFNNLLVGPRGCIDEVDKNKIDKVSNLTAESPIGLFVDPDAGDYRLLTTSPAKNRGTLNYYEKKPPATDREGRPRSATLSVDAGAY